MSDVTYRISVSRSDGSRLSNFEVYIYFKHDPDPLLLDWTELHVGNDPSPLVVTLPDADTRNGLVFLNLRGPADEGRPGIKNYRTEIQLFRKTGGDVDFVFENCPDTDLWDGHVPISSEGKGLADSDAPVDLEEPAPGNASLGTAQDFTKGGTDIVCIEVAASVGGSQGNKLPGYAMQVKIHDAPPLTNVLPIDPTASIRRTRIWASRTMTYVYLIDTKTGQRVVSVPIRTHQGNWSIPFIIK